MGILQKGWDMTAKEVALRDIKDSDNTVPLYVITTPPEQISEILPKPEIEYIEDILKTIAL